MPGNAPNVFILNGGCDGCLTVASITHRLIWDPFNVNIVSHISKVPDAELTTF